MYEDCTDYNLHFGRESKAEKEGFCSALKSVLMAGDAGNDVVSVLYDWVE